MSDPGISDADIARERAIERAVRLMVAAMATGQPGRARHFERSLRRLVAGRSLAQVARMESEMGLP